jgi:DNA polymerase III epsilon subunit-like protein
MIHLNGHLLVAIDFETTGQRAGFHEIIQIGIVPLDNDIRPLAGAAPFYKTLAPIHEHRVEPAAMIANGLDLQKLMRESPSQETVKKLLAEWFERLDLAVERQLIPIAHNWAFESSFLNAWLGVGEASRIFRGHDARDSMIDARFINDRAVARGKEPVFPRVGLGSMCRKLGITNNKPHDALSDCLAEAEVYRHLVHMDLH